MIEITSAIWRSTLKPNTPSEMLTLVRLGDFADHRGQCYPKLGRVAEDTGVSLRSVKRSISGLERQGFLDVSKTRERGPRLQNTYQIKLDKLGISGDSLAPQIKGKGDKVSPTWVPKMSKSGAKLSKPPAPPYRKNRQELTIEPANEMLRYRNPDTLYDGPEYQPGCCEVAS
jgi:hypothetical protein